MWTCSDENDVVQVMKNLDLKPRTVFMLIGEQSPLKRKALQQGFKTVDLE